MTQTPVLSTKDAESCVPTTASVKSNSSDKSQSLLNGFIRLTYHESITADHVGATYIFADTGNSTVDDEGQIKSVLEGLPLVGTEEFELKLEDNNENVIHFSSKNDNALYVNKVTPVIEETNRSMVSLRLVSSEAIRNEQGSSRINIRMDGRISDHIKTIFKDFLKSEKLGENDENIEETSNNYNFIGNGRKAFYTLNWLSKFGIPSKDGKPGDTAGFLFYETSKGYHFKSIDALFGQEYSNGKKWKKKFIYNESVGEVPAGYDGKILQRTSIVKTPDAQEKLKMGAYQTKLVVFDPFNCAYRTFEQTAEETERQDGIQIAGTNFPKLNDEFQFNDPINSTRTTFMLYDTGTLPTGDTDQQIESNATQNFESQTVLNQAIRRYNQLFSAIETITIVGDFSLHAGDAIFVDFPSLEVETSDDLDTESGGLYIIADICHYITSKETFTKMNLVRDSVGRVNPNSK
tara:strand:+ start:451 stop:1839 length:1389 start_codon:yes stop_codon:yes gene_type:complete